MVLFVLFVAGYVCLNNYLIMFFYHKSYSASTSTRSMLHTSTDNAFDLARKSGTDRAALFFLSIIPFSFVIDRLNSRQNAIKLDQANFIKTQMEIEEKRLNKTIKYLDLDHTLLLDPQDIEITGMDFGDLYKIRDRYPDKFVLLNESFFDEDEYQSGSFINNIRNESNEVARKEQRPCVHPILNPYDSEIMQFVKKETELKCNPKRNWIYVENGTIRVAKSAIKKHGTIVCAYIPLYR